jgi:phenylacetate-CoA ligase
LNDYYHARYLGSPHAFKLYREYNDHGKLVPAELQQLQFKLLKKMLIHARDNTVFYRKLFSDCAFDPDKFEDLEQLEKLPPMTKDILRENEADIIARNIDEKDRHQSVTGGTSGVKLNFYRDNPCRGHRLAVQWRSDTWTGWEVNDSVAYIWPVVTDIDSLGGWKSRLINKYVTGFIPYAASYLNDEECNKIVRSMQEFKPFLIRCFPASLITIAEYMQAHNLTVPSVKAVIPTGEPLFPHQRELFEKTFNAEVFNLYASRETGTIAAECSHHGDLHIASDSLLVEVTDNGKRLPDGTDGEFLITDLRNFAFPFIRYAINDFGQLTGEQCPCGMSYPMMKNIVGRVMDVLYDADGNHVSPIILALHLIAHGPEIGQMQIIQNSIEEIVVRLSNNPPPDDSLKKYFTEKIKELIKGVKEVKFDIVDKIAFEKSGKYRFTINNLKR